VTRSRGRPRLYTPEESKRRQKARKKARHKERYATDPLYREKVRAKQRVKQQNPEHRAKMEAWRKARMKDPEYAAKIRAKQQRYKEEHREEINARSRLLYQPRTRTIVVICQRCGVSVIVNAKGHGCKWCGECRIIMQRERARSPERKRQKNNYRKQRWARDPEWRALLKSHSSRWAAENREYVNLRDRLRRHSKPRKIRVKKEPIYRGSEYQKMMRDKRMENPEYRVYISMKRKLWRETHRQEAWLQTRRYTFRKKLLSNPNIHRILAQAVLAQLEQLGFPASVLRGVADGIR
jgi:hypothetical protein